MRKKIGNNTNDPYCTYPTRKRIIHLNSDIIYFKLKEKENYTPLLRKIICDS